MGFRAWVTSVPGDLWQWVYSTTTLDSVLSTLGVATLAVLFATNRILTRGQHADRIADLVAHHGREIAVYEARLAEAREKADGWKEVALEERAMRVKREDRDDEIAETMGNVLHVLQGLDRALPAAEEASE